MANTFTPPRRVAPAIRNAHDSCAVEKREHDRSEEDGIATHISGFLKQITAEQKEKTDANNGVEDAFKPLVYGNEASFGGVNKDQIGFKSRVQNG